jgi:hypothetical protein
MPSLRGRAAELHRKLKVVHIALHNNNNNKEDELNIPTPDIKTILNIHATNTNYYIPKHYVRTPQSTLDGMIKPADKYDLLLEDIEWAKEYKQCSEEQLQEAINIFEKAAGRLTRQFDCRSVFSATDAAKAAEKIGLSSKVAQDIYQYWVDKRNTLGKALIRKFQDAPHHDDHSPYVAFRPREREKRQTRNVRSYSCIAAIVNLPCLDQKE